MKKIKIIYQPGFGGTFLSYLFSLDPSTVPHIENTNDVDQRLKNYNFENTKKFSHWSEFHTVNNSKPRIYTSKNQVEVTADHPTANFVHSPLVKYYVVDLSYTDFANFWLVRTKEKFGNFPVLFAGQYQQEIEIRQKYQPTAISIDCFLDKNTWQDEYVRVSQSMELPLQLVAAQKLYNSWYDIRVEPIKKEFADLLPDRVGEYLIQRQQHEKQEPEQHFFNRRAWENQ